MSGERGRLTLKSTPNARCGEANPGIPAPKPHRHSSALIGSTPLALIWIANPLVAAFTRYYAG
jgi:hypothetical protein